MEASAGTRSPATTMNSARSPATSNIFFASPYKALVSSG
jgi:hypothetical protein